MGQKDPICEQTPDGGAVCSDGTYQTPSCGDPQVIAKAASTGSVEAPAASVTASPYVVPVAIGVGVLAAAAFFFLR
jgi:hypothetical protein